MADPAPTSAPATPTTTPAVTAPPPAKAPPAETPAADARTQKEALAAIQKARTTEKELDAARKAIAEKDKILAERDPEKLKERLRTAPWDALIAAFPGMSKADITKALLGAGKKVDPVDQTARELAALKKQIDDDKATRTQQAQASRSQAVLAHCMHVAKAGGDEFELVAFEMEADPERWQAALLDYETRFPKHDARQALADFEALLLQRDTRRATLRKVRALHGSEKPDPKAKEKPAALSNPAGSPRTLTQVMASERATATGESPLRSKQREVEEAREAAIAAFTAARRGG